MDKMASMTWRIRVGNDSGQTPEEIVQSVAEPHHFSGLCATSRLENNASGQLKK